MTIFPDLVSFPLVLPSFSLPSCIGFTLLFVVVTKDHDIKKIHTVGGAYPIGILPLDLSRRYAVVKCATVCVVDAALFIHGI
jgi:hypothetical protein